ncbi:MAG: hypothetical protein E6Q97_21900 [Desulfurellales bacterium]|nr:MAG: hypothetical protein E6Q97_21900 [Desulfurellales bacterium]
MSTKSATIGTVGPTGATGAAGANGNTVLTTSGMPSNGTGANSDFAYDPAASIMYGPKVAGSWPTGVSLAGTNGTNGSNYFMAGSSNGGGALAKRYLKPWGGDGNVITAEDAFPSPIAGTITRIRYYADAPGTTGTSGNSIYGLEVNGIEVATITTSITANSGSSACNIVVAKGDKIAFTINHTGSISTGHTRPKMFAEFA